MEITFVNRHIFICLNTEIFFLGGYAGFKCSMTKQNQTRSCFYEKSPRLDATDGIDFTTVLI